MLGVGESNALWMRQHNSRPVDLDTSQEMHRMLAVHEIISNIVQHCRPHVQAVAARVSRFWCDVALDWLWRDIDSILPLMRLLAPLVDTESGLAFAEKIQPRNWERFRYYGRRVRCLRYDDSDPDGVSNIASSSFASDLSVTLFALKPDGFGPLLPNVQELYWTASHDALNLQHALAFLNSSVKTLDITLNDGEDDDIDIAARFLCTISGIRGVRLETFKFESTRTSHQLLQSMVSLLQEQQSIKVLDIDIDTPSLLTDTAQDSIYTALPKELKEFVTDLELKEFVTDLVFRGSDDYLIRARTLVRQAPQLRSLKLYLNGVFGWWPSEFRYLTPFLELSELENLEFVISHHVNLDPGDIAIMGKSFPKMMRFVILPPPYTEVEFGIEATTLIDFAAAFPKLQVLGINIEDIREPLKLPWRSAEQPSHSQPPAYPSFNSSTFRLLDVGPSFLSDDDIPDMAELLSVTCHNPQFEIENGQLEEDSTKAWRKVQALVKLVHGAERDTTKPYHEWCQALILENMDIQEAKDSMILEE
ncbi:hypothetical protein FRC05_009491 [Tulasnella sp. 425]|nr:hypothetical protein FRC05_009491 [Tulasnella sp. 425]